MLKATFVTIIVFVGLLSGVALAIRTPGEPREWALYYATLVSVLLVVLYSFIREKRRLAMPASIFSICACFYFVLSIIGSYKLVWWEPNLLRSFLSARGFTTSVFLGFLVYTSLRDSFFRSPPQNKKTIERAAFAVSMCAVIWTGCRELIWDDQTTALQHYAFFVGPIELLRQGGTLLRNVPSAYGFLNILFVSKLRFLDSWGSFLVVDRILNVASGILIFVTLHSSLRTLHGILLSLLVTATSAFWICGWAPTLLGPYQYPSSGAFRFIFCYVFLSLIAFRGNECMSDSRWRSFGNCLWVLALLWSPESGVYATSIWLTFHLASCLIIPEFETTNTRARLKNAIKRIRTVIARLIPWPLLGFLLASFVYKLSYGFWPDWLSFVEYPIAFKAGYFALPIDFSGPVWFLIITFILSTSIAAVTLQFQIAAFPALAASLAAFWAVSSYFVSRSHENNVTNLLPIIIMVLAVILKAVREAESEVALTRATVAIVAPVFFFVTFSSLINENLAAVWKNSGSASLSAAQEASAPGLQSIFELKLSIKNMNIGNDCFAVVQNILETLPGLERGADYWLPFAPFFDMDALKPNRKLTYMRRFADPKRSCWIIRRTADNSNDSALDQFLSEHYRVGETRQAGSWSAKLMSPQQSE